RGVRVRGQVARPRTGNRPGPGDVSTQVPMEAPSPPWRCPMRRSLRVAIAPALLAGLVLGTGTVAAANRGHHKILDVPLIGLAVPRTVIAGGTGAGHAWAIDEGNAKLFSDGRLLINVEGLVLTPEGTNPVAMVKGEV